MEPMVSVEAISAGDVALRAAVTPPTPSTAPTAPTPPTSTGPSFSSQLQGAMGASGAASALKGTGTPAPPSAAAPPAAGAAGAAAGTAAPVGGPAGGAAVTAPAGGPDAADAAAPAGGTAAGAAVGAKRAAPGSYPNLTGDLDAKPEILSRLDALAAKKGMKFNVTSGTRTIAEQQRLWDNRASNPYPVARPGTSNHQDGRAADVTIGGRAIQDVIPAAELRAAGLVPLAGDAVHVQLPS